MQINTIRKKQIYISISALIIVVVVYIIYPAINEYRLSKLSKNITPSKIISSSTLENIFYIGTDPSGKQYNVKARLAGIQTENQDIINLIDVDSDYLLNDGTIIKVTSEKGIFNKNTNDIIYQTNVKITHLKNAINCDKAEFLGKSDFLTMSGNIMVNLVDKEEAKKSGKITGDNLTYDTKKKVVTINSVDKTKQVTAFLNNEK